MHANTSNGLLLKALENNKKSSLTDRQVCPDSFGYHMVQTWQKVKPDLDVFYLGEPVEQIVLHRGNAS
jgi:hypothetical protein